MEAHDCISRLAFGVNFSEAKLGFYILIDFTPLDEGQTKMYDYFHGICTLLTRKYYCPALKPHFGVMTLIRSLEQC